MKSLKAVMKCLPGMIACLLVALLPCGCATTKPIVHFSAEAKTNAGLTYAVYHFTDGNADRLDYPHAADVVTAAFETALLPAAKLVKQGDENVSVFGTVTAFYRGAFAGRYTTVGFEVKAVHKQTGTILWTASHIRTTKWDYKYEPSQLAREMAQEVVDQLLAAGKL